MTTVDRLQAMMARACFGKDAAAAFDADLAGFLDAHGIAADDRAALLASPRRLGLYRRLVRHNVTSIIDTMLERTRARLSARLPGELDRAVELFLDEVGPRTPHLRDVPAEFFAFIAPRWRADPRLPPWLADHAEFELVDFTIGVAPRPSAPPPLTEVTADLPLVFAEPKRLVPLGWAVHELSADDWTQEPAERPVVLLVYRDGEHRTRFLELTPLAAAILERLFAGDALVEAMKTACATTGHPLDDDVLAGAARVLADLGERGVLLGALER
jgi:hypothetical protein